MKKAIWNDTVIAESEKSVVIEGHVAFWKVVQIKE